MLVCVTNGRKCDTNVVGLSLAIRAGNYPTCALSVMFTVLRVSRAEYGLAVWTELVNDS